MMIFDRLNKLIDSNGVTPYEVSAKTGISEATLSRILNNITSKPNQKNIEILANYFNVDIDWLRTGVGEMSKKGASSSNSDIISIPASVWEVISNQAESLKAKDRQMDSMLDSLKTKDAQTTEVIALLKEQLKKSQGATGSFRAANPVVEEDE